MPIATLPDGATAWTRELADAALPMEVERREVLDGRDDLGRLVEVLVERDAVTVARPTDWLLLTSPLDVPMPWGDVTQPDIVVLEPAEFDISAGVLAAPTMVVEVLSDRTRGRDLVVKRRLYERHGTTHYVIVDADDGTFTWLRRDKLGRLVEVALAHERLAMDAPYVVELTCPELTLP